MVYTPDSILGSQFFLVSLVLSPGNTIALYADDWKTSWIIDNPQDHILPYFNITIFAAGVHLTVCILISRSAKDLGLLVSYHLSWNSHINRLVSSAIRTLAVISRTCKSHFFYPVVWSPQTKRNIDLIERVQRRATKLILKSDCNYESCLKELNLNSLEQRHFLGDVTFFIKFLMVTLM